MNRLSFRSSTIDGVIAESMRFFGAMALASPWIRPYWFGWPGAPVKSSISLLSRNPAPCTVTALPNPPFSVVVIEAALPSASTIE